MTWIIVGNGGLRGLFLIWWRRAIVTKQYKPETSKILPAWHNFFNQRASSTEEISNERRASPAITRSTDPTDAAPPTRPDADRSTDLT